MGRGLCFYIKCQKTHGSKRNWKGCMVNVQITGGKASGEEDKGRRQESLWLYFTVHQRKGYSHTQRTQYATVRIFCFTVTVASVQGFKHRKGIISPSLLIITCGCQGETEGRARAGVGRAAGAGSHSSFSPKPGPNGLAERLTKSFCDPLSMLWAYLSFTPGHGKPIPQVP